MIWVKETGQSERPGGEKVKVKWDKITTPRNSPTVVTAAWYSQVSGERAEVGRHRR